MTREVLNKTSYDVIYLAACALHGITPEAGKVEQMDLQLLYPVSQFHAMTAIVCMALEKTAAFATLAPELQKKWTDGKNKAIRKNMMLDSERNKLFSYMDEHSIWHMPLKGSVLKDLYPRAGMRQMGDNDILFDAAFRDEIKGYMESQGYQIVSVGIGHHDVYKKPPIYYFELHTALFGAYQNPVWVAYYDTVKDKLIRDREDSFGYHFKEEDFYVYLLTHAFKHYDSQGTGLRSLLDVYVYRWKKGDVLDFDYIRQEVKALGIQDFEQMCRQLSDKLFQNPAHFYDMALSAEERGQIAYFAGSGIYGSVESRTEKALEKLQPDGKPLTGGAKLKYCWQRLFPKAAWMKSHFPACDRHSWLIPFFWIYRLLRSVLFRRKRMKQELRLVQKTGRV
jgi:hypothetical protein